MTHVVARCIARQDGAWMVLTLDGKSAVSPSELPEGARIVIRDGKAVKA